MGLRKKKRRRRDEERQRRRKSDDASPGLCAHAAHAFEVEKTLLLLPQTCKSILYRVFLHATHSEEVKRKSIGGFLSRNVLGADADPKVKVVPYAREI